MSLDGDEMNITFNLDNNKINMNDQYKNIKLNNNCMKKPESYIKGKIIDFVKFIIRF